MNLKPMKSKYPGKCKQCKTAISAGDSILWSKDTGALCMNCGRAKQGETQSESSGNSEQSGQTFKPEIPRSSENERETYFTINWRDLRETVKSALRGDTLKLRKANQTMIHRHTSKVTESKSFHGYTRNQLERWTEKGYESGAIHGLGDFTPPLRDKRHYVFTEDGDEIHVDRALSGEDFYAGDWTKRERIPGVALEAEVMFAAMVSSEIVNAYNTWICRAVYALESAGIDCQVTLKFSSDNVTGEGKMNHTIVKVKSENEQADFLSFSPMLSPAALRSFGFTALTLHAESRKRDARSGLGHGRRNSTEWKVSWNAERRVLTVDCPYIPRGNFPEESMDSQFREALHNMKSGNGN